MVYPLSHYSFDMFLLVHLSILGTSKGNRGPFLEAPGNLTGPKSYFAIKVSRKLGCVLTSNEVHFVSLADNFIVQFSNLLKLSSGMENKTAYQARKLLEASRNRPLVKISATNEAKNSETPVTVLL